MQENNQLRNKWDISMALYMHKLKENEAFFVCFLPTLKNKFLKLKL